MALAAGVLASGALAQSSTTSQVFQVDANLFSVVLTNGFEASKGILTGADIINLARGRAVTSAVPTNELLGLVVQCGEDAPTSLIVFDNVSNTNLVTVANIDVQGVVQYTVSFVAGIKSSGQLRADAVLAANFGVSGGVSNGWTSGILAFPVFEKFTNSGSCAVQSISGNSISGNSFVGNLKGIQSGTPFAAVITKGKIIASGRTWTLVE
jgi:hypothetical protein